MVWALSDAAAHSMARRPEGHLGSAPQVGRKAPREAHQPWREGQREGSAAPAVAPEPAPRTLNSRRRTLASTCWPNLRERIGSTSFFLGLDRLAGGNIPITTDDLQAVFEETSGEDLADFFDYWIHGGRIPKIELTYAVTAGDDGKQTVEGCLASDVPLGSFDVPVAVEDGMGEVGALVDVDDGKGHFKVPGRTGEVAIHMDKKKELVLYARTVRDVGSVDKLACLPRPRGRVVQQLFIGLRACRSQSRVEVDCCGGCGWWMTSTGPLAQG